MVPIRNLHKRNFFLFYRWTIIDCLPLDYHCLLTVGPLLIAYRWTIIDCLPLDYHCLLTVGLSLLAYRWTIIACLPWTIIACLPLDYRCLIYRWTIIACFYCWTIIAFFTVRIIAKFAWWRLFLNLLTYDFSIKGLFDALLPVEYQTKLHYPDTLPTLQGIFNPFLFPLLHSPFISLLLFPPFLLPSPFISLLPFFPWKKWCPCFRSSAGEWITCSHRISDPSQA